MELSLLHAASPRIENQAALVVAFDLDNTIICADDSGNVHLRPGMIEAMQWLSSRGHKVWICSSADRQWVDLVFKRFPALGCHTERIMSCEDIDPATCGIRQFKDIIRLGIDLLVDDHEPYREDARRIYGDGVANRYIILPKFTAEVLGIEDGWRKCLTDKILCHEKCDGQ